MPTANLAPEAPCRAAYSSESCTTGPTAVRSFSVPSRCFALTYVKWPVPGPTPFARPASVHRADRKHDVQAEAGSRGKLYPAQYLRASALITSPHGQVACHIRRTRVVSRSRRHSLLPRTLRSVTVGVPCRAGCRAFSSSCLWASRWSWDGARRSRTPTGWRQPPLAFRWSWTTRAVDLLTIAVIGVSSAGPTLARCRARALAPRCCLSELCCRPWRAGPCLHRSRTCSRAGRPTPTRIRPNVPPSSRTAAGRGGSGTSPAPSAPVAQER